MQKREKAGRWICGSARRLSFGSSGWRVTADGRLSEERCCAGSGSRGKAATDVFHNGGSRVVFGSAPERHHHVSESRAGIGGIGFGNELAGRLSILKAKSDGVRFNDLEKVEEII